MNESRDNKISLDCGDGRSISALERELAETKIKLADSETTNDVYLKQILSTKK